MPTIGHLDPAFGALMEGLAARLRTLFGVSNRATLAVSGTGSAGMEAMVANFVWPGERVVVGVCGLFGARMADALSRAGAEVEVVSGEWGRSLDVGRLSSALRPGDAALFVVHGETSTGVVQGLDGLASACDSAGALLMIDCVTSLGGAPLDMSGVDVAFSGSQKCLNCPPGLAPFTASDRAMDRLFARTEPCRSWYLDLRAILSYWRSDGEGVPPRAYHHTAPINMLYALDCAAALVLDEGLHLRWERHSVAHSALRSALAEFGFERLAPEAEALAPLLCVRVPAAIAADEAAVRRALLLDFGIEVSGGLGPLAGQVWRVGVMGEGARIEPQRRLVSALAELLPGGGAARAAALDALEAGWTAWTAWTASASASA
jgi:alanine-glyoxylate transaminase/serine-glyoxylate transaminase/serine-pyruvate transaminase